MARVFITGSADGLGQMAARLLLEQGHEVMLHARNEERANDAKAALPGANGVIIGDLSSIEETKSVADQANESGHFDAVIHNAGIGNRESRRIETVDGLEHVFAINVLAPYLLTALIIPPARLIYLSSGLHRGGSPDLSDLHWVKRHWDGPQAYNDSKLFDVVLAFAMARLWPTTLSNSIEPGWVATKMGGPGARDDLALGAVTQAWLAVSKQPEAAVSGAHFFHQEPCATHPAVDDPSVQSGLLGACAELTGIEIA
jgi:NAD(P)-dependent dehydrogenase (short-subunit alcohol dehydrogenase family)